MDYPFSVFMGFGRAIDRLESRRLKTLFNIVRVGASDNDDRAKKLWKELSRVQS